jgi:hypothetical protein
MLLQSALCHKLGDTINSGTREEPNLPFSPISKQEVSQSHDQYQFCQSSFNQTYYAKKSQHDRHVDSDDSRESLNETNAVDVYNAEVVEKEQSSGEEGCYVDE